MYADKYSLQKLLEPQISFQVQSETVIFVL